MALAFTGIDDLWAIAQRDADSEGVLEDEFPPLLPGGVAVITVAAVMTVLDIAWTGMRMWARRQRNLSLLMTEDILCYLAVIFNIGSNINYVLMTAVGGLGHHYANLNAIQKQRYAKASLSAQLFYAFTLGFVKLSIVSMLQRIFCVSQRFHSFSYVIMGLAVAWMMQTVLIALLLCRPVSMNWDPNVSGTCGDSITAYSSVSIVDLITDLIIITLPMRMIFGLEIATAHKIALVGIFAVGIVTMIFTAIRLSYIYTLDTSDITYTSNTSTIIGIVQMGIAIMVASSALMRPVFDRTVGVWFGLSLRSHRNKSSGGGPWSKPSGAGGGTGTRTDGLVTIGRLSQRGRAGFRHVTSESQENLQWELTENRGRWDRETTVQGTTSSEDTDGQPKKPGEILVTKSTVVE